MRPLRTWQDIINDWAPELSAKLGRPVHEITSRGIGATDFSPFCFVEIREPCGKVTRFSLAFALIRPEQSVAAVFSEHCGYVEFDLLEDTAVVEIHEHFYMHQGNS
ncbi:MAG: hypothetical protein LBP52_04655 [Burkholderiaceae bacterium]|jgi:hypothetical protein|nr:hypothetical protein [Burkholderiaceae bacterium]